MELPFYSDGKECEEQVLGWIPRVGLCQLKFEVPIKTSQRCQFDK